MPIRTTIKNGDIFVEEVTAGDANAGKFSVDSPITPKDLSVQTTDFTAIIDNNVVYTLSGSTIGLTGTLPTPSNMAGQFIIFRSVSQHEHLLTGSVADEFSYTGSLGSTLKFGNAVENNHSVALVSDGNKYLIYANTGSLSVS